MSDLIITLDVLSHAARRTLESPPRISIYDVIAVVKGCSVNAAGMVFRRLLEAGLVLRCEEVSQNLIHTDRLNQDSHGGPRRPVVVATAVEMVQILWALPGSSEFRKKCADVVVRYLGGDTNLVEEVFLNRDVQEHLATAMPTNAARAFGEAVESFAPAAAETWRKRLLDDVRAALREENRQTHVWSFSKRSKNHRELLEIGRTVHGDALRNLDEAEHVVRIVDFLKDRIEPLPWARHGRKFKNIYTVELKRMKLRECREEGLCPPVAYNQGEHRIVYTEADTELMIQVLDACRPRFEAIADCDAALFTRPRSGQRSIIEFMRPRGSPESDEGSTASHGE